MVLCGCFSCKKAKKPKRKEPYSTRDSLVVPYQSTDRAQRCLTSQFGWDAVLSPWYDRMTISLLRCGTLERKKSKKDEKRAKRARFRPSVQVLAPEAQNFMFGNILKKKKRKKMTSQIYLIYFIFFIKKKIKKCTPILFKSSKKSLFCSFWNFYM